MAYNLKVNPDKLNRSVRIGNWYEEQCLQSETGVRYYPDPKNKANASLLSHSRVIEHTEKLEPTQYRSTMHDTLQDPRLHSEYKNYLLTKNNNNSSTSSLGPRTALLYNTIKNNIDTELERRTAQDFIESRRLSYTTTSNDTFATTKFNNKNSLDFTSSLSKSSTLNKKKVTDSSSYIYDTPITYYSYKIFNQDSNKNIEINFPLSFVNSTNPFKRSSCFSSDLKDDAIARHAETFESHYIRPNIKDLKNLYDFKKMLFKKSEEILSEVYRNKGLNDGKVMPGDKIRYILDNFYYLDKDYLKTQEFVGFISKNFSIDLPYTEEAENKSFNRSNQLKRETLKDKQFEETEAKKQILLSIIKVYDKKETKDIYIKEMCNFLCPKFLNNYRRDLIYFYWNNIIKELRDVDRINIIKIKNYLQFYDSNTSSSSRLNSSPLSSYYLKSFLEYMEEILPEGDVSEDDFVQFYYEVSAEYDDDEQFENVLKETWDSLITV